MFLRQRSPDPLILDQVWNSKWDQPGGWAWSGYKNEELDRILDTLRSEPSFEKRCESAKQAQKIIMENALMLPTLTEPVFIALSPKVRDFQMGAEGNWFYLHSTALDR
jgi:peptide/nickel transport system substrate-binding protein